MLNGSFTLPLGRSPSKKQNVFLNWILKTGKEPEGGDPDDKKGLGE